jgi:hypothetical protein
MYFSLRWEKIFQENVENQNAFKEFSSSMAEEKMVMSFPYKYKAGGSKLQCSNTSYFSQESFWVAHLLWDRPTFLTTSLYLILF